MITPRLIRFLENDVVRCIQKCRRLPQAAGSGGVVTIESLRFYIKPKTIQNLVGELS